MRTQILRLWQSLDEVRGHPRASWVGTGPAHSARLYRRLISSTIASTTSIHSLGPLNVADVTQLHGVLSASLSGITPGARLFLQTPSQCGRRLNVKLDLRSDCQPWRKPPFHRKLPQTLCHY